MTDKYLCIHGHFYQPPRENPWLDVIEYQPSAQPFHDWNERITRECYGPNARVRLVGNNGHILKLINNYEYMSFNFGPTLLSWLEKARPWVYSQILSADEASRVRYQGHGNALAQVYNHIIMPLANSRDKLTQIRWGLADFKLRFGRPAEGMWLSETAVDTETLKLMAQEGVRFTILSPSQAQSVRPLADKKKAASWRDVSGEQIDPTRPYRVLLDRRGHLFIDVFFYQGPTSRAVAYEKILASGKDFLVRIEQLFDQYKHGPRLVNLATDGESYGHHFKFGDMALSWLFHHLDQTGKIKLTNYGLFLERFPPEYEVKIFENSSWSCSHGIERWRADCGCTVSHTPGWNQAWRAPLREGLDWLAGALAAIFKKRGKRLFKDPWEARDEYVTVFPNPSADKREEFLKRHTNHPLSDEEKIEAFQLMESQRMSLYMFTSCGWFFDEISGLEATQVLKYALRAVSLAQPLSKKDLEHGLVGFLVRAKSNDPAYGHGEQVYKSLVRPSWIDPSLATAHYALAALMEESQQKDRTFSEMVRPIQQRHLVSIDLEALLGEARVIERVTGREYERAYLVFRRNGKALSCLVGEPLPSLDVDRVAEKGHPTLTEEGLGKIEAFFCQHLASVKTYEVGDLIADTQRLLIRGLIGSLGLHFKDSIREHYAELKMLMSLLPEAGGEPEPKVLAHILPILVVDELERLISTNPDREHRPIDWSNFRHLATQARLSDINLNDLGLKQKSQDFLYNELKRLFHAPDAVLMKNVMDFLRLSQDLNLELDLWESQNVFYDLHLDQSFTQALSPDLFSIFNEMGRQMGFQMEGE